MSTNRMTFDDLRSIAKDLGEQAGKGTDTQERYILQVIESGYLNVADLAANKHGGQRDDAVVLAGDYLTAKNASVTFDKKSKSHQKLVSCTRTGIKLGMYPRGGDGAIMKMVGDLMSIWRNEAKVASNRKNMKDAFNTIMDVARVQIRRDTILGDVELKGLCYKPTKEEAPPEKIIASAKDKLEALVASGQDTSVEVSTAIRELHDRLRDIAAKGKV